MKKIVVYLFFGILTSQLSAQTAPQVIADSLQTILQNSLPSNFANSGVIMEVHVPGQWTWTGAAGSAIAGITAQQPQTTATSTDKFRAGSITKMMVAACILKLEEAGLLSINDPIGMHLRTSLLNDTIASSDTVRIRHLLNHTSGIANSGDNTSCQTNVLTNPLGSHSLEEAIYCGASLGEVFPPEFAWAYSNTNYSILAMIIENVSGQSYSSYLTQNIITPLSLANTEIPATSQIQGAHMGCYWNIGNWIDLTIINPTTYTGWADVVTTTHDLNIFYKALRSGQILNANSWAEMQTMYPSTFDYGLGLDFYTISGQNYVGHYGEVANTSGCFYGDISSGIAPNGYYISYNFNVQGADMQNKIDVPVFQLLNSALGTEEISAENIFSIYPNPATSQLTIRSDRSNVIRSVVIRDLSGRSVSVTTDRSADKGWSIPVADLARGAYLLTIVTEEKSETHKIILH